MRTLYICMYTRACLLACALQWRHDDHESVSNHQPRGDRWIPRINGQQRGKCFHFMTSSWCERENMHGCVTWIQFTQSFHFRWNISYWKHFLNFIKYEYCHSPKSLTKRTRFTYIDEAETKWPPLCRRHFQIHFLTWRWLYIDSNFLKFARKAAINNTQLFR